MLRILFLPCFSFQIGRISRLLSLYAPRVAPFTVLKNHYEKSRYWSPAKSESLAALDLHLFYLSCAFTSIAAKSKKIRYLYFVLDIFSKNRNVRAHRVSLSNSYETRKKFRVSLPCSLPFHANAGNAKRYVALFNCTLPRRRPVFIVRSYVYDHILRYCEPITEPYS